MSLYTSDHMSDILSKKDYSMFHLQNYEVKVMERMSTRNARRKISLPSPLPGILELEDTPPIFQSNQCHDKRQLECISENQQKHLQQTPVQTSPLKDKPLNRKETSFITIPKNNRDIKQKAQRRFSVTDHYPIFPYLDPNKKCVGKSDINQEYTNNINDAKCITNRNKKEEIEDFDDLDDEILLLPDYILSLDSEAVETSLDPLLSVDNSLVSGDSQWKVRHQSKQGQSGSTKVGIYETSDIISCFFVCDLLIFIEMNFNWTRRQKQLMVLKSN